MTSIMTNASALTALQSLSATNKALEATQARISTGYRVAEAADNAAYWSIATTMRSDHKSLSTVQDALGLGASKVDIAYTGMNKALDTVNEIKVKLVAANGASAADKDKIDVEIKALQQQLKSYAASATFSGANWLSVNTTTGHAAAGTHDGVDIVSSFNRDASGTVTLGVIAIDVQKLKLYDAAAAATGLTDGILDAVRLGATGARSGALAQEPTTFAEPVAGDTYTVATITVAGRSDNQVTQMLNVVEEALEEMMTAATNLGAAKKQIDLQKQFTTSIMDSIDRGVGQLVDADMNKESTRLQALQVQQQLGIQALTIANSNAQRVLALFQS